MRLRKQALEWRSVEDEVVALDVDAGLYLGANASGAVLWSALAIGATRGELADRLREVYGLDPQTAERDVEAFLGELRRLALLDAVA